MSVFSCEVVLWKLIILQLEMNGEKWLSFLYQ